MVKMVRLMVFLIFSLPLCGSAQTVGAIINDPLSFNGYTLFTSNVSKSTFLIDNCGHLIKRWESDYRPNFSAYLLEDGSLLRAANIPATTQGGFEKGGIQKFSWNGTLIWEYSFIGSGYAQHHDIEPLPNGNVLVIVYEKIPLQFALASGRNPAETTGDIWSERIIELQPEGPTGANIVWEWRLWDHLIQDFDSTKLNYGVIADQPERVNVNFGNVVNGDWLHFNAIDYNPTLDQIVVSSRTFNELFIIDHSTSIPQAASSSGGNSGKGGDLLYRWGNPMSYNRGDVEDRLLSGQHHAHWIEEGLVDAGKLMVFNNGIQRPEGVFSTIDVIDPPMDADGNYILNDSEAFGPQDLSWTYVSTNGENFYSSKLSGAQRLLNGNTLICEGNSSRLFEVTYDGDIVWDYQSPISAIGPIAQGEILASSSIFRAFKYAPDYPAFIDNNIVVGDVLELDPWTNDCQIYENVMVDIEQILAIDQFQIAPNPVEDEFSISNINGQFITVDIYNISSKKIMSIASSNDVLQISSSEWPAGCYFIQIVGQDGNLLQVSKLIK